MPRLGSGGAPPVLPIALLWLGAAALVAGTVALSFSPRLLIGHSGSAGMVALVHTFTLGFVSLVFAGTLQQLPAVMFVTRLAWPRLGYVSTPLLLIGTVLIVCGFAAGFAGRLLALGGLTLSVAWLLLLTQHLATALRRWPKDAGGQALVMSVVFLTLTVFAGLILAGARTTPQVAATVGYPVGLHMTLGFFGAFLLGIIGSGQKLLQMFALSKGGAQWRVRSSTWLVAAGITAEALRAFAVLDSGLVPPILIGAAALLQLHEVHAIHKRRLRRKLEAPIQRYVLAHLFLPVAALLWLAGLPVAAAAAFLVGFTGMAVSGMLVKIMSFLVWTATFAGSATGGVAGGAPLLRDLVRDELEPVTTWGLAAGTLALCAALATQLVPLAYLAANLLLIGAISQLLQVTNIVLSTLRAKRRIEVSSARESAA